MLGEPINIIISSIKSGYVATSQCSVTCTSLTAFIVQQLKFLTLKANLRHVFQDKILGSRLVCEDFDLWKSTEKRRVVSFGLSHGWTFEEEMAKKENTEVRKSY